MPEQHRYRPGWGILCRPSAQLVCIVLCWASSSSSSSVDGLDALPYALVCVAKQHLKTISAVQRFLFSVNQEKRVVCVYLTAVSSDKFCCMSAFSAMTVSLLLCPAPRVGTLSDDARLTSVCLSRTNHSHTQIFFDIETSDLAG